MRRSLPALLAGSVLFTAWFSAPATARSDAGIEVRPGTRGTVVQKDGNDTKGPLDLSGISIAQAAHHRQVFTLTTISPFTLADITITRNDVAGNFFVGIDTNDDRKMNYRLYLYYRNGLRAVLLKGNNVLGGAKVSRPNQHTIWASVPLSYIGSPANYWILAASASAKGSGCTASNPCLDYIPNRYPLILTDITPPVISNLVTPGVANDTTYGVSFSLADMGAGSGIRKWAVQRHVSGTWTDAVTGSTSGAITAQVPATDGTYDEIRVVATDRAGNTTTSFTRNVLIPFDDTDAGVDYTHPGVDWTHPADADAFKGASHVSTGSGSLVTLTFTGSSLCIVGGPVASGLGSAQVSIDGDTPQTVGGESPSLPARTTLGCIFSTSGSGAHTATITTDDLFNFDGFSAS